MLHKVVRERNCEKVQVSEMLQQANSAFLEEGKVLMV